MMSISPHSSPARRWIDDWLDSSSDYCMQIWCIQGRGRSMADFQEPCIFALSPKQMVDDKTDASSTTWPQTTGIQFRSCVNTWDQMNANILWSIIEFDANGYVHKSWRNERNLHLVLHQGSRFCLIDRWVWKNVKYSNISTGYSVQWLQRRDHGMGGLILFDWDYRCTSTPPRECDIECWISMRTLLLMAPNYLLKIRWPSNQKRTLLNRLPVARVMTIEGQMPWFRYVDVVRHQCSVRFFNQNSDADPRSHFFCCKTKLWCCCITDISRW